MKFLLPVILIAIISLLLQWFMPWWSIVIAAALIGVMFSLSGFHSFLSGFFGTAIVWWGYAWMIDAKNQSLLSTRIAELFQLGSPMLLIFICGIVAGLVGGLAAVSGSEIKKLF